MLAADLQIKPVKNLLLHARRSGRRGSRRSRLFLCAFLPFFTRAHRSQFDHFSLERAVSILIIGAAGLFILGDVLHAGSISAFGNSCFVCDLEDTRCLFASNRKCFGVLIDRRNHSVKRKWARSLLSW